MGYSLLKNQEDGQEGKASIICATDHWSNE
jgi:hypothetical protein